MTRSFTVLLIALIL